MNALGKKMKEVWEKTRTRNAHLGLDGEREDMLKRYEALITSRMKVNGKTIIDFGCGGALFGVHLLTNFKPKKYIAFDIAERSIQQAKKNIKDYTLSNNYNGNYLQCNFIILKEHRWNFAEYNPDIIVCLAVMIHFPTKIYLDNFLKTCNESGAKKLVLEIRDTGKGTQFQKTPYETVTQTLLACITNEKYVSERLTNYTIADKTDPAKAPTNCQILWYNRTKEAKE